LQVKARVEEDLCIGSANCESTCPAVFKVVDGLSRVQVDEVPAAEEAKAKKARDGCPSGAISLE
jgi:ferredoxin